MGWAPGELSEPPACSHSHYKWLPDEGGEQILCQYKNKGCVCLPKFKQAISVRECLMCGELIKHPVTHSGGK